MKKVLITKAIHQAGMDVLKNKVEPLILPDSSAETLKRLATDVEGIILRTNTKVTREIMEAAPYLKVISRTGVGVDNIDVTAASERGIFVCNTAGMKTRWNSGIRIGRYIPSCSGASIIPGNT